MNPIDLLHDMHQLLSFTAEDRRRLMELGPRLLPHSEGLANMFYSALDAIPASKAILDAEPGRRMKLHQTLVEWYTQIFSGQYDEAYAQRRWIIGLVHVRIGIPPMFVVASIENVYRFSARKLVELGGPPGEPIEAYIEALTKMLSTDLAFIEQSYAQSTIRAMANEMGTNEKLFQRFMHKGATELLQEARAGNFS